MGLRRRSREMALQILFQSEFDPKISPREMIRRFAESFMIPEDIRDYAEMLVTGIYGNKDEIDGMIQKHSAHWKVARMALVDVNVMRIAAFEMRFANPPVPPNVAINEAVEIAKRFGSTDSGAFVNGILDHIARA